MSWFTKHVFNPHGTIGGDVKKAADVVATAVKDIALVTSAPVLSPIIAVKPSVGTKLGYGKDAIAVIRPVGYASLAVAGAVGLYAGGAAVFGGAAGGVSTAATGAVTGAVKGVLQTGDQKLNQAIFGNNGGGNSNANGSGGNSTTAAPQSTKGFFANLWDAIVNFIAALFGA